VDVIGETFSIQIHLRMDPCQVMFATALATATVLSHAQVKPARQDVTELRLGSPDHRLQVVFAVGGSKSDGTGSGPLTYSVFYDGKPLVDPSALRLVLADQQALGDDVSIAAADLGRHTDSYSLLAGKVEGVQDEYNSIRIDLAEPSLLRRKFVVEGRAYNGGFAFRYVVFPQPAFRQEMTDLTDFHLAQEHTGFRISKDAMMWALLLPDFRTAYEGDYLSIPISSLRDFSDNLLIGLPLLMHVPGVAWMAITEADLEGNSAMYLVNPSSHGFDHGFESRLAPMFEDPHLAVAAVLPHHSAWRVLLVGDQPGSLMESNVVTDLNPPSALKDTSWIHPGKASWDWWCGDLGPDGKRAFDLPTMKYYVDFAAQSKFPYMLLDAGWSALGSIYQMWPESAAPDLSAGGRTASLSDAVNVLGRVDVPELVRYAAQKGVKIWIWIPYIPTARQMDTAFPIYQKWGVVGVKIDLIQRDDQTGIQFYYDAAREAAAHHLMVDFHGATKPWGLERTWPNVLGFEAVLGMEYSKFGMRDNPLHRTIIPFTRMLAGPMDYTPGGFNNVTPKDFIPRQSGTMVLGTRAQQLALYVVDLAPFQMVSDAPAEYAGQPSFKFIQDVPVVWDETRVLDGYPGEYVTIARRSGADWYLGSITNWTDRDLEVSLAFLGAGKYEAEVYEDATDAAENPKHVSIHSVDVTNKSQLKLHLASGGGCAIRIVPKQ
jgi:alpha-glucosidase